MTVHARLRRAGATALAALTLGAAPAALLAATPADTLVMADAIDDIITFDPQESFELSTGDALNNLYDGLIELDPVNDGTLIPGLAESWSLADDGVTYTLQDEVRHHLLIGQPGPGGGCGLLAAPRG